MRPVILAASALLALAGAPALAADMPQGAIVLPGALAAGLLKQCSRGAPAPGEATWQPQAADILALEALLPKALTPPPNLRDPRWSKAPAGWGRQYVGIVRGGRRFIYGNFYAMRPGDRPTADPVMICDGGPTFFGVEYDVAARRITRVDFNGIA